MVLENLFGRQKNLLGKNEYVVDRILNFFELFEIRRQFFHILICVFSIILILTFEKFHLIIFFGSLFLIGKFLSFICMRKEVYFFSNMLRLFERKKVLFTNPGKGALMLILGILFSILLFSKMISIASIFILGFGDSASTVIGTYFGKFRIYKKKTYIGFVSGIIFATLTASLVLPFWVSLLVSTFVFLGELFLPDFIDDNIFIPVISGVLISVLI